MASFSSTSVPIGAPRKRTLRNRFIDFARRVSKLVGSHWAFLLALLVIVGWALTGPMFHFSDTWQLVINTGTTIVTFLMVFLIQNSQNRDAKAIHLKLDELIRSVKGARNDLVLLENMSEEELDDLADQFQRLRNRACAMMERRKAAHASHRSRGSAVRNSAEGSDQEPALSESGAR
jgi:low affinity Fe/Cu permease